nr:unnamed protein product [Callosobruchus analis]
MTKKKTKDPIQCGKCNGNITKSHYSLKCAGECEKWYHKKCTGLTDAQFLTYESRKTNKKWICVSCTDSKLTSDSEESDESDDDTIENPSNKDVIKTINVKFAEIEKAITFNGEIMEQLQETIKSMAEENKKLKREQEHLKNRVGELEKEVAGMKKKLSLSEMEGRKNNVIISGINGDRDAETNVKKVLSKLDIEEDICKITVLPTSNTKNAVIIVRFPREELKKQVLEKRKKVALTHQACGISEQNKKIYVNEDLPRETREMYKKARELRAAGYRYVWCKNYQVYARKEDGGAAVRINNLDEVEKLKTR